MNSCCDGLVEKEKRVPIKTVWLILKEDTIYITVYGLVKRKK